MARTVVIRVSEDDAVEIAEALHSKRIAVLDGQFGPEDAPGDNERWAIDLARIQTLVQDATETGLGPGTTYRGKPWPIQALDTLRDISARQNARVEIAFADARGRVIFKNGERVITEEETDNG